MDTNNIAPHVLEARAKYRKDYPDDKRFSDAQLDELIPDWDREIRREMELEADTGRRLYELLHPGDRPYIHPAPGSGLAIAYAQYERQLGLSASADDAARLAALKAEFWRRARKSFRCYCGAQRSGKYDCLCDLAAQYESRDTEWWCWYSEQTRRLS